MRWLKRKCLDCCKTTEVMCFKTGILEGEQICPSCGSSKGENIPEKAPEKYDYIPSNIVPVLPEEDITRLITWTVDEFNLQIYRKYKNKPREDVIETLKGSLRYAIRSLDMQYHMDKLTKATRTGPKVKKGGKKKAKR